MTLGCSIKGFYQFCHSVICINVSHLKNKYLGTLFIIVVNDDNNKIYLLAFDVGANEGMETWTLFLRCLQMFIEDVPNLAIISY